MSNSSLARVDPAADAYAGENSDALAAVLALARDVAKARHIFGDFCLDCQRHECRPTCVRGRLLAWLERVDGRTP